MEKSLPNYGPNKFGSFSFDYNCYSFTRGTIGQIVLTNPMKSCGLNWVCQIVGKGQGSSKIIDFELTCNPEVDSTFWGCDITLTLDMEIPALKSLKFNYWHRTYSFEINPEDQFFVQAENNVANDYNGKAKLEINILKANGFGPGVLCECLDLKNKFSGADKTIQVSGTTLHVNSAFLMALSPYFNTYFSKAEFSEAKSGQFVMKDMDPLEFEEFLRVIHPPFWPVDEKSVEYILRLADFFDVRFATDACEKFLVGCKTIEFFKKFDLACRYRMPLLQSTLLKDPSIKNAQFLKSMKNSTAYGSMCPDTLAALLHCFASLP